MKQLNSIIVLSFILLLVGGCHTLDDVAKKLGPTEPLPAPPAMAGGPMVTINERPGEDSLLGEYTRLQKKFAELNDLNKELVERLSKLEKDRDRLAAELAAEQNLRAGVEAERDEARLSLKKLNIRMLNLALQKTKSDRKNYELMIEVKALRNREPMIRRGKE